ncbi:MAG: HAMP domain-containing protein, partial [Gemmatimonadetes bacterium]|nr:HAMP domain-containing protein [Gemmatimonadota bacterium]NIR76893.1 HAMP domain-containing protein [Gemmatimonadota bacterium]NIT85414.1 HAMP domain-containing protein [Gemmatimonadota bacterium]NIU29235.1 HAMP domain-containing protein [Gemmatimonadota bacterium]NIU34321.1 HAMP domain-containing protein [Gemmatimonadota bacterium]
VAGGVFAAGLGRPVRALATAAGRVAQGDFDAPVPTSSIDEVRQVAEAFRVMREALAQRLRELESANRELEERQARLSTLQAELIQRDRLAAAGRLLAQLAHEIRNPVANVRNCLELIRRRTDDPRSREFADLAIDELLRMHELAEQMLDLHRPTESGEARCDAGAVARDIVKLVSLGLEDRELSIRAAGAESARCRMPEEALKQVLLNVVQNAREAVDGAGEIELRIAPDGDAVVLEVADDGPGLPPDMADRIFDPFVTTKTTLQGAGLGLFIAEATVRRHGGRIAAANREDGPGAIFTIEVPRAEDGGGGA